MLLHKKLLLKLFINNKWFTLKFFKLLWNKTIVDYWGIDYIEIIMYMTYCIIPHINLLLPYQPEGQRPEGWNGSRVYMGYDTKNVIS